MVFNYSLRHLDFVYELHLLLVQMLKQAYRVQKCCYNQQLTTRNRFKGTVHIFCTDPSMCNQILTIDNNIQ